MLALWLIGLYVVAILGILAFLRACARCSEGARP